MKTFPSDDSLPFRLKAFMAVSSAALLYFGWQGFYEFKVEPSLREVNGIEVLERTDTPVDGLYLYRTPEGDFFGNIDKGVVVNGVLEDLYTGESLYQPKLPRSNLPYIDLELGAGAGAQNQVRREIVANAAEGEGSAIESALQAQLAQIQANNQQTRLAQVPGAQQPAHQRPSEQAADFTTAPAGAIPRVGFDNNGRPLTPAQKQSQTAQLMESLPEQWMMVYPASEERHVVTVMTDPTCPYCRALHESVEQLNANGVTVRYLFYPRALNAGPNDPRALALVNRINSAWCSSNQEVAFNALFAGESPGRPCSTLDESDTRPRDPTADHFVIGQILDVTGTPHIVHHTGKMWQGFSGVDAFMSQLAGLDQS